MFLCTIVYWLANLRKVRIMRKLWNWWGNSMRLTKMRTYGRLFMMPWNDIVMTMKMIPYTKIWRTHFSHESKIAHQQSRMPTSPNQPLQCPWSVLGGCIMHMIRMSFWNDEKVIDSKIRIKPLSAPWERPSSPPAIDGYLADYSKSRVLYERIT